MFLQQNGYCVNNISLNNLTNTNCELNLFDKPLVSLTLFGEEILAILDSVNMFHPENKIHVILLYFIKVSLFQLPTIHV